MKKLEKIAIIHNLTDGGAFRIVTETNRRLFKYYKIKIFSPSKLIASDNLIIKIIHYLIYLYKTLPEYYKKVSKIIDESHFKAVIVHPDVFLKTPTALRYLKTKTIYFMHEPPREFYEPIYLHAPLFKDKLFSLFRIPIFFTDKLTVKKASYVLVNSKFSKKRIDTIYGVDSYVFYPGTKENVSPEIGKRKNVCLSVGSLLPYKGHDLTILAIGMMKRKPDLILVGNGRDSEKKYILDLAKKNNVRIKIISNLTDGQLDLIYDKSKVYVNSAYQEPFGLTSLEALSHGMNLVTVDKCGTEELKLYYKNNVLVVKRDPKNISRGIEEMMSVKHKKQKIPDLFKWQHITSQLIKKIEE